MTGTQRRRRGLAALLLACTLALTGCVVIRVPTDASPSSTTPSVTPTADQTQPSTPPSSPPVRTVAPPSSSAASTSAVRVLDITRFVTADFSSPSGNIWCAMWSGGAACGLPHDYEGTLPPNSICPDIGLEVNSIEVTHEGTKFYCSTDPTGWPYEGAGGTEWHAGTGFGFTKDGAGRRLAMLPYGNALKIGKTQCSSNTTGVRCSIGGHGFNVRRAGVELF